MTSILSVFALGFQAGERGFPQEKIDDIRMAGSI
jgi:hypothetical protein